MSLDLFAIDRLLAVEHREDDQPCNCDECMSYGAEDNGVDWARIPLANRIAIRILDGADDRFAGLTAAFRDHDQATHEHGPDCHDCLRLARATVMSFAVEAGLAHGPEDADEVVRSVVAHLAPAADVAP